MTYIITKLPHVLDGIWGDAIEALCEANSAMDRLLGDDCTDKQLNAAGEARTAAILAIMALPARHVGDSLYKLDLAGIDSGHIREDCDPSAILNEACEVLDEAIGRGLRKKAA